MASYPQNSPAFLDVGPKFEAVPGWLMRALEEEMMRSSRMQNQLGGYYGQMVSQPGQWQAPMTQAYESGFQKYLSPLAKRGGIGLGRHIGQQKSAGLRGFKTGQLGTQRAGMQGIMSMFQQAPSPTDVMGLLTPEINTRLQSHYGNQAALLGASRR